MLQLWKLYMYPTGTVPWKGAAIVWGGGIGNYSSSSFAHPLINHTLKFAPPPSLLALKFYVPPFPHPLLIFRCSTCCNKHRASSNTSCIMIMWQNALSINVSPRRHMYCKAVHTHPWSSPLIKYAKLRTILSILRILRIQVAVMTKTLHTLPGWHIYRQSFCHMIIAQEGLLLALCKCLTLQSISLMLSF